MHDQKLNDADKSRSLKKRESTALQKRGEELAALGPGVWKTLPLPTGLFEALHDFRSTKSHEAGRRQMQYIGRLMREADAGEMNALLAALDGLQATSRQEKDALHSLEALRERLLHPEETARDAALREALAASPALSEARLRHLAEAALAEREKQRPPKHARELFRYLRETLLR
jgi:ribosome-associated protein